MKVASYNIRKAVGLDWRRNPERVEAVIAELDADVIALQEVDRRFGARSTPLSARRLSRIGYRAVGPREHEDGMGYRGNAVLVRAGLDVTSSLAVALPGLEPRGAVVCRVEGLTVVGAHLGLTAKWRRRQITQIVAQIGIQSGGSVVLGDFNEWRASNRTLSDLPKGYDLHVPGHSFHAAAPRLALDMIITGPGVSVRQKGVHRSVLARKASDHLPVWAELVPERGHVCEI